jgi:subtilisin family serine protease
LFALLAGLQFPIADSSLASSPQPLPRPARVAIIDSGIARTPELNEVLLAEYDMASVPPRQAFQPRYSHGTMVATVLKRSARQPISIVSLRIDDPNGCPPGAAPPCQPVAKPIADAIDKAAELDVSAINISLALKDDPMIVDAVRRATQRGILVVMAAGNEGRDRPRNLDAAKAGYPRAILVGALDPAGKPWSGTNRPESVTNGYVYVWQPGVSVPTALADGAKVHATGTSFAAPIQTAQMLAMRGYISGSAR